MQSLDHLLDRPKLYYNIDGVGELVMGFMCLGYALFGWMQVHSPEGSFWHWNSTFLVYLGVMWAIIHYGSKAIKERITYPRTGRVEYSRRDTVWMPMILGAAVSMASAGVIVVGLRSHWDLARMTPLVALVLAAATYAKGFARAVRWKWAVVCGMAVCSIAMVLLPAGVAGGIWPTIGVYGVMLSISGGISLWMYLRETHAPEER